MKRRLQCFCNIVLFFRMWDLTFCSALEFFFPVEMCISNPTVYCDIWPLFVFCGTAVKWSIFSGIEHILWVHPCVWVLYLLKHRVSPCKCIFACMSNEGKIIYTPCIFVRMRSTGKGKFHSFCPLYFLQTNRKKSTASSHFWKIVKKGF